MNIQQIVRTLVLAVVLIAAPAAAVSIFADGFNNGTLCSWGPSGCVVITPLEDSATTGVEGHTEWADYEIEFAVWAPIDVYIDKEAARGGNPTLEKGLWFAIKNTDGVYESGITPFWVTGFCPYPLPCTDTPTHFKVLANTPRTFRITVRLDNAGGTVGFYKAQVMALSYGFSGNNVDGTVLVTNLPANLDTSYVFVDDENVDPVGGPNSYEDFHSKNHL